jgi:small-conductance mechanosensitive channel
VNGVLTAVLVVAVSAGAALIFAEAVHLMVVRLGRRSPVLADLARKTHRSFRAAAVIYAVEQGLRSGIGSFAGRATVLHGLLILIIAASAWLVAELLLVIEDAALQRWRTDVPDNLRARRVRTQIVILRRVTVAAVVVVAFGAALMTFREVRLVGTSVLASAGLVSVVAALAAQSTLGNLFAGLQLAFSDAVRIDDVVVVEEEWGKVEELTLTYVALHVWDDRRLILPTSYFTTKPFQNWTRSGSAVLGTAEIDVDWSAGVEDLRTELRRICEASELWDKRVCVLQVTDATGGNVRLRALVSAADAAALWDLRCLVREHLVTYVFENAPEAVPRVRAELDGAERDGRADVKPHAPHRPGRPEDSRVFSGGVDGEQRGAVFGPESPDSSR